jgi:hypothetical protein
MVVRLGSYAPADHAHQQVAPPVVVEVAEGRRVVAARQHRVLRGNRTPCCGILRLGARSRILEQQQSRLEEIAPEQVEVAVAVVVIQRHRVGAVHAPLAGDDLEVLEPVGDELERRRRDRRLLRDVLEDDPRDAPHQQVGIPSQSMSPTCGMFCRSAKSALPVASRTVSGAAA